jgi:hypothetical protein
VTVTDRLIRVGIKRGWDRGLGDGNRFWLVVGGVAVLARLTRRAMRRESEVIFSEKLAPGESIDVYHQGRL